MSDETGVPGLFIDGQDFADAFAQALSKLRVEELPEFHTQLVEAFARSRRGDHDALSQLAMALVIEERLSENAEYKRAVKDVLEQDRAGSPTEAIDHHELIHSLRAG